MPVRKSAGKLSGRTVLVVGAGNMGALFLRQAALAGARAGVYDADPGKSENLAGQLRAEWAPTRRDAERRAFGSDIVIVCVPMDRNEEVFRWLFRFANGGRKTVWVETGSVKDGIAGRLLEQLPRNHGLACVHLLTSNVAQEELARQRIVITHSRRAENVLEWLKGLAGPENIVECSEESHDRRMAVVQSALHFLELAGIIALEVMMPRGKTLQDMGGHTRYAKLVQQWLAAASNPSAYAILEKNPFSPRAKKAVVRSFENDLQGAEASAEEFLGLKVRESAGFQKSFEKTLQKTEGSSKEFLELKVRENAIGVPAHFPDDDEDASVAATVFANSSCLIFASALQSASMELGLGRIKGGFGPFATRNYAAVVELVIAGVRLRKAGGAEYDRCRAAYKKAAMKLVASKNPQKLVAESAAAIEGRAQIRRKKHQ